MKKERKDAFQIKLEKETRKIQKNRMKPVIIACIAGTIFLTVVVALSFIAKGFGMVETIKTAGICFMFLLIFCILFTIFLGATAKSGSKREAYNKIVNDINRSLVDKMLRPDEQVEVFCTDVGVGWSGKLILKLQTDGKIKFYAALGEDGSIHVYAILEGETKKWEFDVVSKEDFLKSYQVLDS